MWRKLASHLHLSLQRCQRETTFFELLEWIEFLRQEKEEEFETVEKLDYYLAQIASMVVAVNSKDPKTVKVSDFFVKLDKKEKEKKKLTKEERTRIAKAFWMRIPSKKGRIPRDAKKAPRGVR